jgi:GMP synthase (glutamine-hydrolysing)
MKPIFVFRHVQHEGIGTIADALLHRELPYTIVDSLKDPLPRFESRNIAGLVVMGGPMNVDETDKYPALAAEVVWMRNAVEAEIPVLGVCLGSQLLAKALGARVYANRVKEIGWYDIELVSSATDDPLFAGLPQTINVFQWHGDTFDLPARAVHLARSPQCENQAFRFGKSAYGLQFHLEVTDEIIDDWLGEPGNCGELSQVPYIDPEAIRRETPVRLAVMEKLASGVFDRFAELCRGE